MPILFGDIRSDGKIRVWRTQHICPVAVGSEEYRDLTPDDIKSFPEGWWFDAMPEFPLPQPGKDAVWLFDPKKKKHSFEEQERPLTQEELMQAQLDKMTQLLEELGQLKSKIATLEGNM